MQKSITKEKESGRFYTPYFIVESILDLANYRDSGILKKHVIDNSCGDGAFLTQIVKRYCEEAKKANYDNSKLKKELSKYIHGIEIEPVEKNKCIKNVSEIAEAYGIYDVNWDIICDDTLNITKYNGKMDYVIGNPPYVRVHNLNNSCSEIKKYSFAQNGMTDLYIVFFEIGINMLNSRGILGYITPSSYFNSIAGLYMRKFLADKNLLKAVVDLKHYQAFSATTYTAITILENGKRNNDIQYYRFDNDKLIPYYVDTLTVEDYLMYDNYFFAKKEELLMLKKIFYNTKKADIAVKNGYATLCDKVFINDFDFSSELVIPVIKASRGIEQKIIYPYDKNAKLLSEDCIKKEKYLYKYLLKNKKSLTKRSAEKDLSKYWYAFGRSQAISDTYKNKLAINSLLRSKDDFKFIEAPVGTGVYGGLYLISNTIPIKDIIAALKTDKFISYIMLLGKYKSGGYYTFSSKDVKVYLDYIFAKEVSC